LKYSIQAASIHVICFIFCYFFSYLLDCLGALSSTSSFPFVSCANIEFALFSRAICRSQWPTLLKLFISGFFLCFACLLNFCMRFSSSTFCSFHIFIVIQLCFPRCCCFWPNVCTSLMFSTRAKRGVSPMSSFLLFSLAELKFKAPNCQPVTQKFNICSPYNLRALFISPNSSQITNVWYLTSRVYNIWGGTKAT